VSFALGRFAIPLAFRSTRLIAPAKMHRSSSIAGEFVRRHINALRNADTQTNRIPERPGLPTGLADRIRELRISLRVMRASGCCVMDTPLRSSSRCDPRQDRILTAWRSLSVRRDFLRVFWHGRREEDLPKSSSAKSPLIIINDTRELTNTCLCTYMCVCARARISRKTKRAFNHWNDVPIIPLNG